MSTQSAKKRTRKTRKTPEVQGGLSKESGPVEVVSGPSTSRLAELYRTDEFKDSWANDIPFHVARNLFHLRRYRRMSQVDLAKIVNTSQSAIARIESGQENITLDTVGRLANALGGRFEVAIRPRELTPQQRKPWWEADANPWRVTHIKGRRTSEADQIIFGMERLNELSSADTLPVSPIMLPPSSATTPGDD